MSVRPHGEQRLERQVGVDRLGAIAGERAEMMDLARFAGLDDEADRGAEALADQVMMDARRRQQRRDRDAVAARSCGRDRMMMLSPAWTAISASENSWSSAASMPSAPSPTG